MRILLDTQVWLWLVTASQRLGPESRMLLDDGGTDALLSSASAWEIAIKYGLGKLPLPDPPEKYVPKQMRLGSVEPLPVLHSHALHVASLHNHHRDPFDRILVAQAQVEGLVLASADRRLSAYDVEILDATL